MYLKLNERYGGAVLVNMNNVQHITADTGGTARLWFSADDADTMLVHERFDEVEQMIEREVVAMGW